MTMFAKTFLAKFNSENDFDILFLKHCCVESSTISYKYILYTPQQLKLTQGLFIIFSVKICI